MPQPAIYYTVTQQRQVEVVANNEEDAAIIAGLAFQDKDVPLEGIWGHTVTDIRVTELAVVRQR